MKREVWVECLHSDWPTCRVIAHGREIPVKRETIHESRWIPVSERMPEKPGHYHVVRLDREDWCYCEMLYEETAHFTSKGVTHWIEAPPVPVEEEWKEIYGKCAPCFEHHAGRHNETAFQIALAAIRKHDKEKKESK